MHEPNSILQENPHPPALQGHGFRHLLFKRIWLPRVLYESLPVIYIVCGLIALISALYLPGRTWIWPWSTILGLAAIHLGLGIAALRHRWRNKRCQAESAETDH